MKQPLVILEDTRYFKMGDKVQGIVTEEGAHIGKHYVSKDQFVILQEAMTKADEDKIRRIVREMLKKMFWRMYTRSSFITK